MSDLFSEIVSEKPRRKGRPQKYASPRHRAYEKKVLGGQKRTPRSVQNYHNAKRAFDAIRRLDNAAPILAYFDKRQAILAALGRIKEKKIIVQAACSIVYYQLRGAKAYAEIRKFQHGDRWPDFTILLGKIRKAAWQYRNLFPHQSDEQFERDVKITFEHFCKYELRHFRLGQ